LSSSFSGVDGRYCPSFGAWASSAGRLRIQSASCSVRFGQPLPVASGTLVGRGFARANIQAGFECRFGPRNRFFTWTQIHRWRGCRVAIASELDQADSRIELSKFREATLVFCSIKRLVIWGGEFATHHRWAQVRVGQREPDGLRNAIITRRVFSVVTGGRRVPQPGLTFGGDDGLLFRGHRESGFTFMIGTRTWMNMLGRRQRAGYLQINQGLDA